MALLEWEEYFGFDNSYWVAPSIYTTEKDGWAIFWRLRQRLEDNCIVWYEDHDEELNDGDGLSFNTLEEAKAYVQSQHDATIDDSLNHTD